MTRRHDNPEPFSRLLLAGSRRHLTPEERTGTEYAVTTIQRNLDRLMTQLRSGRPLKRGTVASVLDVTQGDVERAHARLMTAEVSERQAEADAARAEDERQRREWQERHGS